MNKRVVARRVFGLKIGLLSRIEKGRSVVCDFAPARGSKVSGRGISFEFRQVSEPGKLPLLEVTVVEYVVERAV